METNKELIKELNKFLKGINMGSDTFKKYEEKAQSPVLKSQLSHILNIFNSHEEKLVSLIQKLGGEAKDSLGISGELASMFEKVKEIFVDTDSEVLEHAIKAVNMGIQGGSTVSQACEKLQADSSVTSLLNEILTDYKTTLSELEKLTNNL